MILVTMVVCPRKDRPTGTEEGMTMGRCRGFALAALTGLLASGIAQAAAPLAQRIGHSDPAKFRHLSSVHRGAGTMDFGPIVGADALSANLIFVHRGVIAPHSGIGEHFHNQCEEMFVILDGEAQFTIDGRTSLLKGPAGVPDRMGHAHAIYNATDKPLQWLNINVGLTKTYDNFDLGDARTDVALDPIPQFISMHLDRGLLKPVAGMNGGSGTVMYRRALDPTVFSTPWSYVDHMLIPPGASVGQAAQADMSEVYYVLSGSGEVTVAGETAPIREGDAVPVDLGQTRALKSTGAAPLELMVIGVARDLQAKAQYRERMAAQMMAARPAR
jgi:mannose-6-phosphate isomerase-like protein (cupin superfamily)